MDSDVELIWRWRWAGEWEKKGKIKEKKRVRRFCKVLAFLKREGEGEGSFERRLLEACAWTLVMYV